MSEYRIWYSYHGAGQCIIEADNPEEAEEKLNDFEWTELEDNSYGYVADKIKEADNG